jgi:AcrR family transcriptional regulator
MSKNNLPSKKLPGLSIKQNRSKKTYKALIAAGFRLIKKREFDSITVAELAKTAGYSVGAFYTRFKSKDEFFDAMVVHHIISRVKTQDKILSAFQQESFIDEIIKDIVQYYWINRRFWRAALFRSIRDREFWEPIRKSGHSLASRVISRMSELAARPLTEMEETNIRFAFQITLGTINNTIINQPGPIFMKQRLYVEKLIRAFRLVSDYEYIVSSKKSATPKK